MFFGTQIPERVVSGLRGTADRHRALVSRLKTKPATRFLEEREKLSTLTWHARVRVALALVAQGPAYMKWRYQPKSSLSLPAYYVIRWWGIFRDGLKTLRLAYFTPRR